MAAADLFVVVDCSSLARELGGDGHSGAAGVRPEGGAVNIVCKVLSGIEKLLAEAICGGVSEDSRGEILYRT